MDKTVLVLGSSGGIGFEVCKKLLMTGHTVIAQFHTNEKKVQSLSSYADHADQLIPLRLNLNNGSEVDLAIPGLLKPDSIVHAGGHHYEGLFEETPDHIIGQLWNVHMYQPARIIRSLIPGMRHKSGASIVFISSIWGETGASFEVMYSAVKGAQIAFVKALGKELAPSGIRVNAVAPGAVETAMTAHYPPDVKKELEADIPAGRFAHPGEIADAVIFLIGDQSTYVNGHVLSVNGGW
ncbi:elongation factor P 5-aminopentanone reductase [Jeotgalibacillus sp. JSM ZJ347]|uniref:elongation factor P 5-aminopentanone reductase n=1 Tax=Jeotgalibacillus sp. JSM ZJ347 TaxID=3342117 RepID=UPI0035A95570